MKSEHFGIPAVHEELRERIARREGDHAMVSYNFNPISAETYKRLFDRLIRQGDTVVNIGAGLAVDPFLAINHLNQQVLDACKQKDATLVVADTHFGNVLTHRDLKDITESQHLNVIQADGLRLPLQDGSVSGIVSSNLINAPDMNNPERTLLNQAKELIEEAWRVLRPGGFILLSSFGYVRDKKDINGQQIYNNDLKKSDLLTLKQLEQVLSAQGFTGIAELEVDQDMHDLAKNIFSAAQYEEDGGYIAYKPRETGGA